MSNGDKEVCGPLSPYEQGLRDGRLLTLEEQVQTLSKDVSILNKAVYLLYGAIAVINVIIPFADRLTLK